MVFGESIPASLGLFALACAGHTTVPALRGSMSNPARFKQVVWVTFGVMGVVYMVAASTGYAYYGSLVDDLVTTNFSDTKAYTRPWGNSGFNFAKLVSLAIGLHCVVLLPLLVFTQVELIFEWVATGCVGKEEHGRRGGDSSAEGERGALLGGSEGPPPMGGGEGEATEVLIRGRATCVHGAGEGRRLLRSYLCMVSCGFVLSFEKFVVYDWKM